MVVSRKLFLISERSALTNIHSLEAVVIAWGLIAAGWIRWVFVFLEEGALRDGQHHSYRPHRHSILGQGIRGKKRSRIMMKTR